jgi:hypothetical protein
LGSGGCDRLADVGQRIFQDTMKLTDEVITIGNRVRD